MESTTPTEQNKKGNAQFDVEFRRNMTAKLYQQLEQIQGGAELTSNWRTAMFIEMHICKSSSTKEEYLNKGNATLERIRTQGASLFTNAASSGTPTSGGYNAAGNGYPTTPQAMQQAYVDNQMQQQQMQQMQQMQQQQLRQQQMQQQSSQFSVNSYEEFVSYLQHLPSRQLIQLLWKQKEQLTQQQMHLAQQNHEIQRLQALMAQTLHAQHAQYSTDYTNPTDQQRTHVNWNVNQTKDGSYSPHGSKLPQMHDQSHVQGTTDQTGTSTNAAYYWQRVSYLKEKYERDLVVIYNHVTQPSSYQESNDWVKRNLEIVLAVLAETPAMTQPRQLQDLEKIESFIVKVALPIYEKIQTSNSSSISTSTSTSGSNTSSLTQVPVSMKQETTASTIHSDNATATNVTTTSYGTNSSTTTYSNDPTLSTDQQYHYAHDKSLKRSQSKDEFESKPEENNPTFRTFEDGYSSRRIDGNNDHDPHSNKENLNSTDGQVGLYPHNI